MAEGKDDLEKYLDDSLHEKDRHALEKRALDDTFLADAVDGAETIPHEDFSSDVGDLKKKIKGKPYRRIFTPLRIAAGVILLIGTSSLIYFLGFDQQENLAEESGFTSTLDTLSAAGKASDSALITMAKPESKTENKRELSQPGRVNNSFDKMKASEADSKSTTDIKKGEGEGESKSEKSGPVVVAEDKVELKSEETKDDRVAEVSPVLSTPVQQSEMRKKGINSSAGISNAKSLKANQQVIDGHVKAEDGTPLPGVNVMVKGTQQGTVTDANGYFNLDVPDNTQALTFSFIGMEPKEIAPRNETNLQVTLKEDESQLSEVVVAGYSTNDAQTETPVIKNASPAGGIKAYNKYLENSLRYPQQALDNKIKGKVIVQFSISSSGQLSDFKVLKSLQQDCDDEVIRLVKEGPAWAPSTQDKIPVRSNAQVKVKFDPDKAKR